MAAMTNLPRELLEYACVPMKGYLQSRSLAAMTAERITIPAQAIAVMFSGTQNFVALAGDGAVTAAWPTDVDDGTCSEVNPTIRRLDGTETHISVLMQAAGEITARFFTKPV